jgi:molybdopterin/thiamine biosynthesis adenylyltransferase
MTDTRFSRNSSIIHQDGLDELAIFGLGGIGSVATMMASIMGFRKLVLWDKDNFEVHNQSTSSYPEEFLNLPKSVCASNLAEMYSSYIEIDAHNAFWDNTQEVSDCCLSAVDDMQIRKELYEAWVKRPTRKCFIDLRMGAMSCEIITVTQNNDFFMETWKPGDQISDELCTARHTVFTAFNTASLGLAQMNKVLSGLPYHGYIWMGLDIMGMKTERFFTS